MQGVVTAVMKIGVHLIIIIPALLLLGTWANGEGSWPYGRYGLPKPKSGCPETTWQKGWRRQDVTTYYSGLSVDSQMDVQQPSYNRTFCVKTDSGSIKTRLWPKGFYCIYKAKYSSCPSGMIGGAVQWNDKDFRNKNQHGGTLPDGVYDSNTKINYCCQNMGRWFDPIELPIHRPFYLLPHNNSAVSFPNCQHVRWTMSWLEYIDYNTVDSRAGATDGDKLCGDHVYIDNLRYESSLSRSRRLVRSLRAYYCYYQGCRYEMNKNEGVLRSPNFNNNPQFTKCSWLITVDQFLKISLQFNQLNLNNCQESRVYIYDGNTEESPFMGQYCDMSNLRERRIISSANQMLVIFSSKIPREHLKTRPSFETKYTALTPGCRFEMNKNEDVLSSPSSTVSSRFIKCSWLITVHQFYIISLQFTRLNHCQENSVLIYDGKTEQSPLLRIECNISRFKEQRIISSGNQVLVILSFKNPSKDPIAPPSFEAKYSAMTPPGFTRLESSRCKTGRLKWSLGVVSLFFLIILFLVIFRGKVMQCLAKLRCHSNGRNEETREQEIGTSRSFENGAFASSNNKDRNPDLQAAQDRAFTGEQNSDGDNYTELIIENIQPENSYESLRDVEGSQNVQNTGADDYVIACVDTKDACEDSAYEYPVVCQ